MTPLSDLLQDNSGGLSSTRLCLLVIVFFTMANWAHISYKKMEMVPIPDSLVTLIIGFGGVKAVQRFGEKDADPVPPVPPVPTPIPAPIPVVQCIPPVIQPPVVVSDPNAGIPVTPPDAIIHANR